MRGHLPPRRSICQNCWLSDVIQFPARSSYARGVHLAPILDGIPIYAVAGEIRSSGAPPKGLEGLRRRLSISESHWWVRFQLTGVWDAILQPPAPAADSASRVAPR